MKKQVLKPWLIIALAFLLVATVVIRIAEYQLPTAAHRLKTEIEDRYEGLIKQHPVPDAENALPVYDEAVQLMLETQKKYPERKGYFFEWRIESDPADYHLWEHKAYVLPLPSQPFPEELKEKIQQCVEIYRPVLEKLHYAATLKVPDVFWENIAIRARSDMEKPLFMEALLCILNNDEAGAIKALGAYKSLTDALANAGRGWYIYRQPDPFWDIYYYGMERNVFSATSLEMLQEMFMPIEEMNKKGILREVYFNQQFYAYYINNFGTRPTLLEETFHTQRYTLIAPVLAKSLVWFEKRLYVHGATATLPGMQVLQRYMLGDASEYISQLLKYRGRNWGDNQDLGYLHLEDPFGRYGHLNFDHMYSYPRYEFDNRKKSDLLSLPRTIIALGRYRAENGVFPENINALKGYVPKRDLYIFHEFKYTYERTDTGWIISYSIPYAKHRTLKPVIGYPLGTVKESGSSNFL